MLMFLAGILIDWKKLNLKQLCSLPVLTAMGFSFFIFPVCQWLLATLLIDDSQYLYGLVLASLCPIAIVAPFFVQSVDSDTELSFTLLVASMILFPFVAPVVCKVLLLSYDELNLMPILRHMVLLVTVPLFIGYLFYRYANWVTVKLNKYIAHANMLCLGVLIFILFGTVSRRLNLHYVDYSEITILLFLVFVQNFVVLFFARKIFLVLFDSTQAISMSISLCMKNYAIAASILLFYDPKAALPATLGFIAHAALFNIIYLARKSKFFRPAKSSSV